MKEDNRESVRSVMQTCVELTNCKNFRDVPERISSIVIVAAEYNARIQVLNDLVKKLQTDLAVAYDQLSRIKSVLEK